VKDFKELYEAVDKGQSVYWQNSVYKVVSAHSNYYVLYTLNGHCVGLYEPDYDPSDFYLGGGA